MKAKLKSILAVALCAVGLAAFAEPKDLTLEVGKTWEQGLGGPSGKWTVVVEYGAEFVKVEPTESEGESMSFFLTVKGLAVGTAKVNVYNSNNGAGADKPLCEYNFDVLEPVPYLDWDDELKKMTNAICKVGDYEAVKAETTTFEAGKTYVVLGNVTNTAGRITVNGTAASPTRLILCDGAELVAKKGVVVKANSTTTNALTICGQKGGTGALTAAGNMAYQQAGIGGNNYQSVGIVTINGGVITAVGGSSAAGIGNGGGYDEGIGGAITINGGMVTATGGGSGAAGIGGGDGPYMAGIVITINGGEITAVCSGGGGGSDGDGVDRQAESTITFGAGFNVVTGETAAVTAPIAQDDYEKDHSAAYVYIEPAVPGSEGNPWTVGDGVEAWTNGTKLVIQGEGTVTNLADVVKGGITAITITKPTVTGAESNAFAGFEGVALSLPDGWQGELPDEGGNWYGATGVTLTGGIPLAVRNVRSQQRYPWNGLVDVVCDLTGSGEVTLAATVLTNGVEFIANPTLEGAPTVDLGATGGVTNGIRFIWNAAKDLPAGFKANDVQLKVTAEKE